MELYRYRSTEGDAEAFLLVPDGHGPPPGVPIYDNDRQHGTRCVLFEYVGRHEDV